MPKTSPRTNSTSPRIIMRIIVCLAATMLALTAGIHAAQSDPPNVSSTHLIPNHASYLVYKTHRAAQADGELHYGTSANRSLGHVEFHCSWTLLGVEDNHYTGRIMEQLCWVRNSRTLRSLIFEGSFRDGKAGSIYGGDQIEECQDLGGPWTGYASTAANVKRTTKLCFRGDKFHLHHNMLFWFRFQIEELPGFYWICHIRSVVANKTFSAKYWFAEAGHIAGRNGTPRKQDHAQCYRNNDGGGGGGK